jgi:hypothetical protein
MRWAIERHDLQGGVTIAHMCQHLQKGIAIHYNIQFQGLGLATMAFLNFKLDDRLSNFNGGDQND